MVRDWRQKLWFNFDRDAQLSTMQVQSNTLD